VEQDTMAIVSMFYGIIVSMYFFDNRKHHLPHVHVKYQEQEAVISIPEGEILEGNIKSNKMKLVQAWIEIHKDELIADWELASQGQNIFKIEPLK
jgi:shikimate kinase